MKVLFITRLFHPHIGGIEKHLEEISRILIKKGYKVTILTTKYESGLKDKEEYKGIKIVRFIQQKIRFLGLIYTWFWLIFHADLIKKSDIVHIHDVFIWYLPLKLLLPKKKIFATFHGWEGKYPIPFNNIVQRRLASYLSERTLTIGNFISRYYGIKKDIVPYGATTINRNIIKLKESVIYVGRLEADTGLSVFLDMLKDIKEYDIEFCGDGEMKGECEKYGKVHGFVDPNPFYAKAKYCFASGYLTIMEAMAQKCLVFVVYDNPLKKDYYEMTPFAKYIVIGKNSEDLLKKFRYYENNPKEAQKKINKGYNWVKHQTWYKMTSDYLKLWGINEENNKVT